MKVEGVKQADAARATGIAVSTISEVLAGKRQLSRGHIEKLAAYFHVGVSAIWTGGTRRMAVNVTTREAGSGGAGGRKDRKWIGPCLIGRATLRLFLAGK